MKTKIVYSTLLSLLFVFTLSCKNETKSKGYSFDEELKKTKSITINGSQVNQPLINNLYPKTGKNTQDFLPKNNIYEIEYEQEGDLNKDGLKDKVLVLENKTDKTDIRPLLVLLQNTDGTYSLDKVSEYTMPAEYTENDYKNYDTEDLSIDSGILNIFLYSIGPNGNLFLKYEYFENDLLLTYIETYNMGAGSHTQMVYDIAHHDLMLTIINTMKEDMPSETKTMKLNLGKLKIENTKPEEVIEKAFNKIEK